MSLVHNNFPARGFLTPPPTCNSRRLLPSKPATERKYTSFPAKSPENIINLPSIDSPYGRAKHVQVIIFIYLYLFYQLHLCLILAVACFLFGSGCS